MNRRNFLQNILSGSAALPLALSFPSILNAAQNPAKNVIFIHMPDGIDPSQWHPASDLTLGAQNSSLESVKQHCTFLRGVDLKNSPFESGTNHDGGTKTLLTNFDTTSINVAIGSFAQAADISITHPYLLLGMRHNFQNFPFSTTYKNASSWSSPILPEDNPSISYSSLFGDIGSSSSSTNSVDLATQRRLKALEHVQSELNDMKSALGLIEQSKLEQNLDAITDLKSRINLTLSQSNIEGAIDPTTIVDIAKLQSLGSVTDLANIPDVSSLNNDIAVAALATGKTRSVTLNYSHNTSEMPMPWIGANSQGHAASHAWGADFNAHRNWYAEQLKDLINKLKTITVEEGTLLDNTMIVFGSDVSHSNGHGGDDMPFIVAGGGQGGRILTYSDTSHEQLLVSAAQFAGMDIDKYGYHFGKTGALSGLLGV